MSWCDKLASTPTMGFRFDPHYRPASFMLAAIAPLLACQTRGDKQTFSVDQQGIFDLIFTIREGFQYSLSPTKFSVAFKHRVEIKAQSAGTPVMEMLSEPKPYTVILPEVARKLVEVTMLMPHIETQKLIRVGIVSTTMIVEDEMPPSIQDIIEYYTRPWGRVDGYSLQIVANIDDNDLFMDRCVHTFVKSEDKDMIPTITLDWQRTFKTQRSTRKNVLDEAASQGQDAALSYFEKLGEGAAFDV